MSRRLTKREAEELVASYDAHPVEALTTALQIVLGLPEASFGQLVDAADVPAETGRRLLAGDVAALDSALRELNETRGFRHWGG